MQPGAAPAAPTDDDHGHDGEHDQTGGDSATPSSGSG